MYKMKTSAQNTVHANYNDACHQTQALTSSQQARPRDGPAVIARPSATFWRLGLRRYVLDITQSSEFWRAGHAWHKLMTKMIISE